MVEQAIIPFNFSSAMLPMPDTMSAVLNGHNVFATKLEITHARRVVRVSQSKRLFDIVFAVFVTMALLSWLVPIIAVLIKIESKGPVFFKQFRTGKDGKKFHCFKFRSMRVNDDSDTKQASRGDARVTKLGAYLRKSSLDELPQFFNVLLGEMSIVGPRPHMLAHTEEYSLAIHNFMDRHLGMPGITGLAQVSGYRGETRELNAMSKRVNADIYYLQNQTLWLDVKIVLLTARQALSKNEHVF
jgi:putative colanic acid biosynthesis UDP-glucose lipid carrier transferase